MMTAITTMSHLLSPPTQIFNLSMPCSNLSIAYHPLMPTSENCSGAAGAHWEAAFLSTAAPINQWGSRKTALEKPRSCSRRRHHVACPPGVLFHDFLLRLVGAGKELVACGFLLVVVFCVLSQIGDEFG